MKEIREMLGRLPGKDAGIAERLLAKRDFSELSLLIWSDIVKIERAQKRKKCPDEYAGIDLLGLYELKILVDNYNMDILYGENEEFT